MSRIQGPQREDPFSLLAPSRSHILGRGGAADPNTAAHPGDTPGSTGAGGDYASKLLQPPGISKSVTDFLARHRLTPDKSVQAVRLDHSIVMNVRTRKVPHTPMVVWRVEGAILYRTRSLERDSDGAEGNYHPPTPDFWLGYNRHNLGARGLGRESLLNAVGDPPATDEKYKKPGTDAIDWDKYPLTIGCKVLRDIHRARTLKNSSEASARTAFDEILRNNNASTLQELENKGATAICVQKIEGRDFRSQLNDWNHVRRWAGIQAEHGEGGKPKTHTTGPFAGYYVPRPAVPWIVPNEHPFLVRTKDLHQRADLRLNFGVAAVVVANGKNPNVAYGLAGEGGPSGGFGECSGALLDDLKSDENSVGDYICIFFPGEGNPRKRDALQIRAAAEFQFNSWMVDGRSGLDVVKDLFPTFDTYTQMEADYRRHFPGDIVLPRKSITPRGGNTAT
jgi:hypothetical protein